MTRSRSRPRRPVGPVWYGPFARFADWYHGLRDGLAAIPDPASPSRSTPTRDYLARRTADAFEHEHLWYERDKVHAAELLAHAEAEAAQTEKRILRMKDALARLPAQPRPEQMRRRGGEWRTDPRIVIDRRLREHSRSIREAEARVEAAQRDHEASLARCAALRADIDRSTDVARARATRLREHCAQRMAAYRRSLLRHHPEPARAAATLDASAPPLPGWLPTASRPSPTIDTPAVSPATTAAPGHAHSPSSATPELFSVGASGVLFGRSGTGAGLLRDPAVPGRFFTLEWRADEGYRLRVLERADDGPYVEGRPFESAVLKPGAVITMPGTRLRLLSGGQVERVSDAGRLVVSELTYEDRGKTRLAELSFAQSGRTVTAVIGPSGAGKTTLFEAILGELRREVSHGSIVFDDRPVIGRTEEIRHLLGYVPQSEDLHPALTVAQSLTFTDRLRRTSGHALVSRFSRIDDICEDLDIRHRMASRVRTLSGGERKRLSIAMEVIKEPRLLMLDEPTSGLDTGLDHEVMRILQKIARSGCTVILTTHAVEHLYEADTVLALAPGGRAVYFGPPADVTSALGVADYTALMKWLAEEGGPDAAATDYLTSPAAKQARDEAGTIWTNAALPSDPSTETADSETVHGHHPFRPRGRRRLVARTAVVQTVVLIHRQLALLKARTAVDEDAERKDRIKAWFMPFSPLLLAAAGAVLAAASAGGGGLRSVAAGPAVPPAGGSPTAALSFLVTVCALTGQALTYSDIVSEIGIVRRECRTGVQPAAVILAKWIVYAAIAVLQAGIVTVIFCAVRGAPSYALASGGETDLFAGLAVMSVAASSLGLLISAASKRLEQAVGFATGAAICQVALNGVTITLSGFSKALSYVFPSRWGMGALASSTDLHRLTEERAGAAAPAPAAGHGAPATAPPADALWVHSTWHWTFDLAILAVFSGAFVLAAVAALRKRLREPAR